MPQRTILAFNDVSHSGGDSPKDEPIVKHVRQLEAQRLQFLDVTPLKHLKSFAQIPQVIHEMGLAITLASNKQRGMTATQYWASGKSYGRRMKQWKDNFSRHYCLAGTTTTERRKFAKLQASVSQKIQDCLDSIMEQSVGLTAIEDEIAIHVWARDRAEAFALFLWAGNEYAQQRRVPTSLSRRVEHSEFDIPLRQAFEGVSSRRLLPASPSSRWAQIMAVPIISPTTKAKHKYHRLLLGVVTLSTDLPAKMSDLSDCLAERSAVAGEIEEELTTLGRTLLIDDLQT